MTRFLNTVHMDGEENETYIFHSVRHLSDQVRWLGPLCNFSVFAFAPVNYFSVRAFSGTIKRPEGIADRFIRNMCAFFNYMFYGGSAPYILHKKRPLEPLMNVPSPCLTFSSQMELPKTFAGR